MVRVTNCVCVTKLCVKDGACDKLCVKDGACDKLCVKDCVCDKAVCERWCV